MTLFKTKSKSEELTSLLILLVLSLLLITKNFSVGVVTITLLLSLVSIVTIKKNIYLDKIDMLVIACLSIYLLSNVPLFIADNWNFRYFKGASRIILCVPIYLYFKYYIATNKIYASPVIWGSALGSLGAFSIACYQFFIEGRPRVDGFLFSINFGYLACSLAVLSIALMKFKSHRGFLILSLIFASSATLMSLTRGAIIVIPIALVIYFIFEYKALGLRKIAIVTISSLSILFFIYGNVSSFQERVNFTAKETHDILSGNISSSESAGGRLMLWRASIEAFKVSPIIGLTYSERETLNKELNKKSIISDWATYVKRGHAHSQYFEQIASGGILGIIALCFMLVVPFLYFFRYSKQSNAAYVGTFFVLAIAICCFTEVALQQNLISTFYGFMLALLFAVTQQEIKNDKEVDNGQIRSQG
ncbi:O-antigen ligase family protein [Vibrio pectenicida]|uniref:O-antigen ligase family protein n=1 Tax=Vibrio pectenicida TaxID=62763 RepID=UPI003B9A38C6